MGEGDADPIETHPEPRYSCRRFTRWIVEVQNPVTAPLTSTPLNSISGPMKVPEYPLVGDLVQVPESPY